MSDSATTLPKHPIQPLIKDGLGVVRFKANAIVQYLLDNGGINLNDLAAVAFSQDDREQFAQLIGYSLSGYGDLSYVTDDTFAAASTMQEMPGLSDKDARIMRLESLLSSVRSDARNLATRLFQIHPDDLKP
jgi:hypothetical protein